MDDLKIWFLARNLDFCKSGCAGGRVETHRRRVAQHIVVAIYRRSFKQ
jgi:hypothetical protein